MLLIFSSLSAQAGATTALNFGADNTTRYHTFPGPAFDHSGDWSIGFWIRPDNMNVGENGFQYILSNGALGGANTINIFIQENNSGASLAAFIAGPSANTLLNAGVAGAWPKNGTDYLIVLQKRGSNFEIYRVAEGSTTATPTTVATTDTTTLPAKTFYVGARADLNATRFYKNPVGEVFILTGDSLTNANIITLAAGKHITEVRTTRAVDLRFRTDNASEQDLSGNARHSTRFGTGYTLATEFFPDGPGAPTTINVSQNVTEGSDSHSASSVVELVLSANATEGSDSHSSTSTTVQPSLTQTVSEVGSDTHSSNTVVAVQFSQSVTEGSDSHSATASAVLSLSQAVAEGTDTHTANSAVSVSSSQSVSEGSDSHSSNSSVAVSSSQSVTEGNDTHSANVTVEILTATATQNATEGADTHSSTSVVQVLATQVSTEGSDSHSSDVDVLVALEPRKNVVRNSAFIGYTPQNLGVVQVNNSGVYWNAAGAAGANIVREVLAVGVTNDGYDYLDIRISGTNTHTAIVYPDLYFAGADGITQAAAPGQTWTAQLGTILLAGSRTGFNSPYYGPRIVEFTTNGSYIAETGAGVNLEGIRQVTRTLSSPLAGRIGLYVSMAINPGQTVDFTLRVYAPMVEKGSVIGPFIRTTGTSVGTLFESGPDTATISTNALVQTSQASTEGTDTTSVSAVVSVASSQAATEGSDSHSSTTAVQVFASQTSTEGADTHSSASIAQQNTTQAATEGSDTHSSTVSAQVRATQVSTEGSDSHSSAVIVELLPSSVTQNVTEGSDTHSSSVTLPIFAEPRKNIIQNSEFINAPVGVMDSAGVTIGTPQIGRFGGTGLAGTNLKKEISGVGTTAEGYRYIDYRIFGTNTHTATVRPDYYLVGLTGSPHFAATVGQTWTAHLGTQIVAGSTTGFESSFIGPRIAELDSGGNYLVESGTTGSNLPGIKTWTRTLTNPNTARVALYLGFGVIAGATVDLTVRIYAPMLERGSVAGPYLPTSGNPIGTLVETGSDSLNSTVSVELLTSHSVSEVGQDTATIAATVATIAAQSATEGSDTQATSASVRVQASQTSTEPADTTAIQASVAASAAISATEAGDTTSATFQALVAASMASTDGVDAASANMSAQVRATQASTEGSDNHSAALVSAIAATQAANETAQDSTNTVLTILVLGTQIAQELADTGSASVSVTVSSSLNASEGSDFTLVDTDTIISLSTNATEGSDTHSANAVTTNGWIVNATEVGQDTHSGDVKLRSVFAQTSTETADTGTGSASVRVLASQASTEGSDTHSTNASAVQPSFSLNATEGTDSLVGIVRLLAQASQSVSEVGQDTHSANAAAQVRLTQAATDSSDSATITGTVRTSLSVQSTESGDSANVSASVFANLSANSTEGADGHISSMATQALAFLFANESGQDFANLNANVLVQVSGGPTEQGSDIHAADGIVRFVDIYSTQNATEGADTHFGEIEATTNVTMFVTEGQDTFSGMVSPARQERNLPPVLVQPRKFGHYRESSSWSATVQPRLYGTTSLPRNTTSIVTPRKYSATVDK